MQELEVLNRRLFVVSGCSSSGKSTLIAALAKRGEVVVPEPGRRIVQREAERGGDGLPWKNAQRFIGLCTETAIRDFDHHSHGTRRTFFDRGLIDLASAVRLTGLRAPELLEPALRAKRHAPIVFLSPPWEALFERDAERRHDFREALAEYRVLVPTYREYGYQPIFLPQASVPERVSFVLSAISESDAA